MRSDEDVSAQYDVVVAGYGPTGMVLAPLLAQRGHRVAVLERYAGLYNLPRAATFDDETMRILQRLGIADAISAGTTPRLVYDWVNAEGQLLARHTFAERGVSGWPEFNMMYQPWFEDQLDGVCRMLPGVTVLHEHQLSRIRQDEGSVVVEVETPGGRREIGARFLVGCDGGNSTVRRLLGIGSDDFGFFEPWLVCDFELKRGAAGLPAALQLGDPAQPVSIFTIDDVHQRFAFMLDDPEELDHITEADVWQKVSRWLTPEEAVPIRIATYTFRSRSARAWRQGRVFLAGDAAHEMPPFLGQGMCSGIRDASNLAWKLDLVLSGRTGESLLDTYQLERAPHVEKITKKAIELGRLQTIRDVEKARARDEMMLKARAESGEPAAYAFPAYEDGFLTDSPAASGRGRLFPQGRVLLEDGSVRRFDDLWKSGFQVVTVEPGAVAVALSEEARRVVDDVFVLARGDGAVSRPDAGITPITDLDRVYGPWFAEHGCTVAVVRPDGYVFGTAARAEELSGVLDQLRARLDRPAPTASDQATGR